MENSFHLMGQLIPIAHSQRKLGKSYWCVETNLGKRIRKYYSTREKAYANAGEIIQSYMSGLDDDSPVRGRDSSMN